MSSMRALPLLQPILLDINVETGSMEFSVCSIHYQED